MFAQEVSLEVMSPSSPQAHDDVSLIQRYVQQGDSEALSLLFGRYADPAYRVALRCCGNSADAEDAVQTAFLEVLRHADQYRATFSFRGWIMRIVINACRMKMKSEAQRRKREETVCADRREATDAKAADAELVSAVTKTVQTLPDLYRLPVWLHYMEGLSLHEVADALALPEKTVSKQASRGLEQVRQTLAAAGFTACALPALLSSIPLESAPAALTESFKALIATKAAGAAKTVGTKGGMSLIAKASVGLLVAAVAGTAALALSNGKAAETPKDPPVKAPAAEPAKVEAVSSAEYEKYFGPQRDWPRFRGPTGNGVTTEKGLPTKWDAKTGENILWSVDIWQPKPVFPVAPYASPIVYKDKVFITLGNYKDDIFSGPIEKPTLKKPAPTRFADMAEFKVVCFNTADGKKLWETVIEPVAEWKAPSQPGAHACEFSWAASTPYTDGERVYAAFGPTMADGGLLAAVDYAGKVVWRQDLGKVVKSSFSFTLCTSPMIYKDMVVMDCITWGGGATVAFDGKTGELKYSVPRDKIRDGNDHGAGAPTPVPVLLKGVPFLLNNGFSSTIEAINPDDGQVVSSAGAKSYGYASLAVGEGVVATHAEVYVEFCTNNKEDASFRNRFQPGCLCRNQRRCHQDCPVEIRRCVRRFCGRECALLAHHSRRLSLSVRRG
ncbi:MAG: sigma-70 family RNA polymerase sigma factor [Planctomycetes bacterium]|nr:sigma-70 family RNA polymerase sigma factor [Planctomycetota bacterium]